LSYLANNFKVWPTAFSMRPEGRGPVLSFASPNNGHLPLLPYLANHSAFQDPQPTFCGHANFPFLRLSPCQKATRRFHIRLHGLSAT